MGACAAKQEDKDEHNMEHHPDQVDEGHEAAVNYDGAVADVVGGEYDMGGGAVTEEHNYGGGEVVHNDYQVNNLQQEFNALDTDQSGRIGLDEYTAARGANPAPVVGGGYEQGQIIYEDQNQGYNQHTGHAVSYDHQQVDQGHYDQQHVDQGHVVEGGYIMDSHHDSYMPADHVKPAPTQWAPQSMPEAMPVYSHNRQVMVSEAAPQMRGQAVEEQYVEHQTLPQPVTYDHEPQQYEYADQGNYQSHESYGYAPSQEAPPAHQAAPAHAQSAH